ncbi:MAG: double-strand break repair helicase AddA, partial [Rhodobacteraceae bacterium]
GDILILVQKRSGVFPEIIRACKALDLPIAGADRLRVGAEMAVKDLRALLSFLATPEDDLSLAVALRSPLLGWDEQALFDLAHRRAPRAFLWQALRDRRTEFPETFAVLEDLRDAADYLRPYDLIERVLIRHEGRRRLLARLGREAEDGIDALLSQALAYERTEVPGLTGFLVWMETDDLEIKRQVDAQGDMIRVMTVHGAKGLEAPVVFLPDTALHRDGQPGVVQLIDGVPVWRLPEDERPEPMSRAQAEEAARSRAERLRLLYVALTRAQSWLIVAAAGKLDTTDGDTWYQRVEAGLNRQGAVPLVTPLGEGLRLQGGDWDGMTGHHAAPVKADAVVLPEMFDRPAPPAEPAPKTLSPSDLGGDKAMPGDAGLDEEEAKARGTRLHLLLEHLPTLPQADWAECARNLVDCDDPAEADALLAEARAVLTTPDLAHVFAPDALAEVPITAQVGGRRLHGTIDRLIIGADHVLAIDYKSNATVPDTAAACPEGLLRQMGAYLAMLEQVFPHHRIDLAILWTRTASLMPLPQDVVRSALARAPNLDLSAGPS